MMDFASFARAHGVLIGTLLDDGRVHRVPTVTKPRKRNGAYRFTGDWGWVQSWDSMVEPAVWKPERRDAPIAAPVRRIPVDETQVQAAACERARGVVARCRFESHAYLTAKGFPQAKGLVDPDGRLVVPMWDVQTYKRIQSVQWIDANGGKKFMPGGAAKGGVYRLGAGSDWWLRDRAESCRGAEGAVLARGGAGVLFRRQPDPRVDADPWPAVRDGGQRCQPDRPERRRIDRRALGDA